MNILKDRKIISNKLSFTLTLLLNVLNSAMIFIHSKQRYTHYCQILFRISLQSLQTKESKPLSSIVTLGPVTSSRFRFIATYERGLEEGQGYSPDPETIPSCARVVCRDHAWQDSLSTVLVITHVHHTCTRE